MSGCPSWARRAIRRVRPQLPAAPLRSVGAPRADRPVLRVAAGDRFDHTTAGAGARRAAVAGTAHTPRRSAERVSGRPVRPHLAQAGSGSSAPRARSSATSLPTTGGAPTSNAAGSAASAAARSG